jgi:hypothetical protein
LKLSFEDRSFIESATAERENTLLSVRCEYLTIDQFAAMHNVSPEIVVKWIMRGKLRHIKKDDKQEWLIPAIERTPSDTYIHVEYTWDKLPQSMLSKYPTFIMFNNLRISQNENNEGVFTCKLYDSETHADLDIDLPIQEVESLEYDFISSGNVEVNEAIYQYIPLIERAAYT